MEPRTKRRSRATLAQLWGCYSPRRVASRKLNDALLRLNGEVDGGVAAFDGAAHTTQPIVSDISGMRATVHGGFMGEPGSRRR